MLLKPCARCRALVAYGHAYCEKCRPVAEEERRAAFQERKRKWNSRYNAKRDPRFARFYGSTDWKRLSKAKMADAGYRCEDCGTIAVEVHHIDPIQTDSGWERRLDWGNLKAVCLDCHNKAHGRFQSKRRKAPRNGETINR